jgi:hypothetical protein
VLFGAVVFKLSSFLLESKGGLRRAKGH